MEKRAHSNISNVEKEIVGEPSDYTNTSMVHTYAKGSRRLRATKHSTGAFAIAT
jgi:hypothetical protein